MHLLKSTKTNMNIWKLLAFSGIVLVSIFFLIWPQLKTQLNQPTSQIEKIFVNGSHSVPVLSITTNPGNLWDAEEGIAVIGNNDNVFQSGDDWERPAHLDYYNSDGKHIFNHDIGLRMHGRNQRTMAQQSFRIYFKDADNRNTTLRYPIFGERGNTQYESLILRNGGGDSTKAMMREQLASELIKNSDSNVDVALGKPVVLYLNGEYWGLYYLRERFDETYFKEKYRVHPDALAIIEIPLDSGAERGRSIPTNSQSEASSDSYNRLLKDAARCTDCLTFQKNNRHFDANNLVDYFIFELYFANFDWPYNNIKVWEYRGDYEGMPEADVIPELDGKFRWLLFDMDVAFGISASDSATMKNSAQGDPYASLIDNAFPFRNFFYQAIFQEQYQERLDELQDTALSVENSHRIIDQIADEIRPEIAQYSKRWRDANGETINRASAPESLEAWEQEVTLLKIFMEERAVFFPFLTKEWIRASR